MINSEIIQGKMRFPKLMNKSIIMLIFALFLFWMLMDISSGIPYNN